MTKQNRRPTYGTGFEGKQSMANPVAFTRWYGANNRTPGRI